MLSTLDVISGGRIELGLGAGWKEDEWRAYGYGFPALAERQRRLRDALEIAVAMFRDESPSYAGMTASIEAPVNVPKPVQNPRLPIVVGGNGRDVTWRLAARYADELNLDNVPAAEMADALAVIAERCREVGREPDSLAVSVHIWWETLASAADPVRLLAGYRGAGVSRVMALVRDATTDPEALERFKRQAEMAGATFAEASDI
jgi:alkanesulfonate monooxygenase SsuD/methylene tetrahydromethanopterin reductase-like flavin-dependent oxidoreductase (luciferase family)